MAGLLDNIKAGLLGQWEEGEPYRAALGGLLMGDTAPVKEALGVGKPWPKNIDQNAMKEQAYQLAMDWNNPIGMIGMMKTPVGKALQKTKYEIAHELAQRNAALPIAKGGLGLPKNNTAMDRARAMGFDTPAYHGTDRKFSEFDPEEKYAASNSMGSWFTDDPLQAAFYADPTNRGKGHVMHTLLRVDNPHEIDAMADARRIADDIGVDPNLNWEGASNLLQYSDYIEDSLKDARHMGRKSLVIRNTADAPNRSDDLATHYSIFDPKNIRLKTAAFDPMQRNSANLLGQVSPELLPYLIGGGLLGAVGINQLGADK